MADQPNGYTLAPMPQPRRTPRIVAAPAPAVLPSRGGAAYDLLRREVIRCRLRPGAEVTEQGLAQAYGFGKTPIREALSRLAQEGLVRAVPRRGYLISSITLKDVQDLFAVRCLLEAEAACLAAGRVDGEELRRLDGLCRAGYDPSDADSAAAFLAINREFHVTIARASRNERLVGMIAQLVDEMERLFHLGLVLRDRSEEMAHEHKALVDALLAGDSAAAGRIAEAQIRAAQKMVVDGFLTSAPVLGVNLAGAG